MLARGLQQARSIGAATACTDFQSVSNSHWQSPKKFYLTLAQSLADELELEVSPQSVWNDEDGANKNFKRYLRREVLSRQTGALVWGLDEVDRLFGYSFSNDVFALFRSLHNARALKPNGPWSRLTLAIAYSTEAPSVHYRSKSVAV